MRSASERVGVVLIIVAACVLRYGDSARVFFFLDDFWLLRDAGWVQADGGLLAIFRPSHTGFTLYRPLTQVGYFVFLRHAFGLDSGAYHVAQLAIFAGNALLVCAIARCLTSSLLGGLAVALLYLAAPGHVVAVFWIAAFTMTGTATAIFALLCWWLYTRGRLRAVGCAVLQTVALLASEHAVIGPALLALCAGYAPRGREPRALRQIAPSAAVVALYLAGKLVYLTTRLANPGYQLDWNPLRIVGQIGRYAIACLNALTLVEVAPQHSWMVGVLVLAFATWSNLRAWRGAAAWRLPALGSAVLLVSVAPVLVLADHYYDYFIGVAALGAALTAVGLCMLLAGRHWPAAALALVAAVFALDVATGDRAARSQPVFQLVVNAAASSARWMAAVQDRARAADASIAFVPRDNTTAAIFGDRGVTPLFFPDGPTVQLYPPTMPLEPPAEAVVLPVGEPPPLAPNRQLPGWDARWNHLRNAVAAPRATLQELAAGAIEIANARRGT